MSDIVKISESSKLAFVFWDRLSIYYEDLFVSKWGQPTNDNAKFKELCRVLAKYSEKRFKEVLANYLDEAHEYPPSLAKFNALLKGRVSDADTLAIHFMLVDKVRVKNSILNKDPLYKNIKKINFETPFNHWFSLKYLSRAKEFEARNQKQELISLYRMARGEWHRGIETGEIDSTKYPVMMDVPLLLEKRDRAVYQ